MFTETATTTFTERPILFKGPLVRGIQKRIKTHTRRIIKPSWLPLVEEVLAVNKKWTFTTLAYDLTTPYGRPGDRLWVRETWRTGASLNQYSPSKIEDMALNAGYRRAWAPLKYLADNGEDNADVLRDFGGEWGKTRVSIHMPRWASRITLEILDIRVERLKEISEADAKAEGAKPVWISAEDCDQLGPGYDSYREGFCNLWDSINAPRGCGWDTNPLVWVIEFKDITKP